jgi:hypothetical protein
MHMHILLVVNNRRTVSTIQHIRMVLLQHITITN